MFRRLHEGAAMSCPKCQGCMVDETARDFLSGTVALTWRCVNCGCVLVGTPSSLVKRQDRGEGKKAGK